MRWPDRVGKGIRTAPRDALVAGSISENKQGLALGFHRATDTGGAVPGVLVASATISLGQRAVVPDRLADQLDPGGAGSLVPDLKHA